jgi:hypothetical protein
MDYLKLIILFVSIVILILVILVLVQIKKVNQENYCGTILHPCDDCKGGAACRNAGCQVCSDNSCRKHC